MKILIVEDDLIIATDLKRTLEKSGHKVLKICKTLNEVLDTFQAEEPDLMLIDIKLRLYEMDGIYIAEEINRNHTLPVIYLTSQTDYQTFERAKATHPAAYLFKPFRHNELVFQVELAYSHYMINRSVSPNPSIAENVFFPYQKGYQRISKKDVLFIKAEGVYVNVFVKNEKKPLLFTMNIGYIGQYFSTNNFYKLTRSYIINLDQITKFDAEYIYFEYTLEKIHIPQSQRQEFLKRIALAKTPKK